MASSNLPSEQCLTSMSATSLVVIIDLLRHIVAGFHDGIVTKNSNPLSAKRIPGCQCVGPIRALSGSRVLGRALPIVFERGEVDLQRSAFLIDDCVARVRAARLHVM